MAVRIRLQRKGAKHMAFFRIVAADSRSPRDGRFIEQLGYYDPLRDPPEIRVETEKVIDWLSKGAQPSETVESLLRRIGIMQTWHEMKRGKTLDELRHIEDEARKRLEAKASMEKRKRESGKAEKADAEAAKAADAAEEGGEPDKAAEPSEEAEPAATEAEAGTGEEEREGEATVDSGEAEAEEPASEDPEPAQVSQEEKPE